MQIFGGNGTLCVILINYIFKPPYLEFCDHSPALHFRGSKYVALLEPFKVLYRTFSSKIHSILKGIDKTFIKFIDNCACTY